MKRSKYLILVVLLGVSLLVGCAQTATPTTLPTSVPLPATATSTPESPKVTLYFEGSAAQFELISPKGERVLMDVYDPSLLSSPATEKDVLLTTNSQDDHFNINYAKSFPGQQLSIQEGEITLQDVSIKAIASAQFPSGEFKPKDGTNYIIIVDIGGLRIVHFGDIGQNELTHEQLEVLGEVDIAITQLNNPLSDMNITNMKGFNLMDQVKPKLIIPTHTDLATLKYAVEKWKGYVHEGELTIGKADLLPETGILFLGRMAPAYRTMFNLPDW
jgi:hypothetical protein